MTQKHEERLLTGIGIEAAGTLYVSCYIIGVLGIIALSPILLPFYLIGWYYE